MRSLDGNASDNKEFASMLEEHISCLNTSYQLRYIVADSKFYYAEHLQSLSKTDIAWISRVPSIVSDVSAVLNAMDLSFSQEASEDNPYAYRELGSTYAGVKQRWLVVYSHKANQAAQKTVPKQWAKACEQENKQAKALSKKKFSCPEDAELALKEFEKTLKHSCILSQEIVEKIKSKRKKTYYYQIQLSLKEDSIKKENKIFKKSFFILASNELDQKALPEEEILAQYKGQTQVEKGFRFLKDPQVIASSFFVNKPQRVEALLFLMTLCLLLYSALEYRLREQLEKTEQTLPNQVGKQTNKPTMKWIFACFVGIHLLYIDQRKNIILNLRDLHHKVLKLLGKNYLKYYQYPKRE